MPKVQPKIPPIDTASARKTAIRLSQGWTR